MTNSVPEAALEKALRFAGAKILLCLDVDGTIVDREGVIYPEAAQLVDFATSRGIVVSLCSARSSQGMQRVVKLLPSIDFISAVGGAHVLRFDPDSGNGTFVDVSEPRYVDAEDAKLFLEHINYNNVDVWAFTHTGWHVRSISPRVSREAYITGESPILVDAGGLPMFQVLKYVIPELPRSKFGALSTELLGLRIRPTYSTDLQVEIGLSDVQDKGLGIICSALSDDPVISIAVGDGANDIGMLSQATIGATFADASESLHSKVDMMLPADRGLAMRSIHELLSLLTREGRASDLSD